MRRIRILIDAASLTMCQSLRRMHFYSYNTLRLLFLIKAYTAYCVFQRRIKKFIRACDRGFFVFPLGKGGGGKGERKNKSFLYENFFIAPPYSLINNTDRYPLVCFQLVSYYRRETVTESNIVSPSKSAFGGARIRVRSGRFIIQRCRSARIRGSISTEDGDDKR